MSAGAQAALDAFLYGQGLAAHGEVARWSLLTGGISSQMWRVDLPGRSICVKRALPTLQVATHWEAPLSRNRYEWQWLCFAAAHEPRAVPRPLAHDVTAGLLAMSFLPPERYPVWKSQLMAGKVEPDLAGEVGAVLARLHNASAHRPELAREFDSLENFHALRIEPYLLATATHHPALAERLHELARRTAAIGSALVHGDVSPKNILVGPDGPVFLDAECAWYGDPAFDLAFCLNHLLLKSLVRPDRAAALLRSYSQLAETYLKVQSFESPTELELRVAELLPALTLARIDGKSPVEYLAGNLALQNRVRRFSGALLAAPVNHLESIRAAWAAEIADPSR